MTLYTILLIKLILLIIQISDFFFDSLDTNKWYLDTGANENVSNSLNGCIKLDTSKTSPIYTASDEPIKVYGKGAYLLNTSTGYDITINNVIHAPVSASFLSYSYLDNKGCSISGKNGKIFIHDPVTNEIMITGVLVKNGLYQLDLNADNSKTKLCTVGRFGKSVDRELSHPNSVIEWHRIMNHVNLFDLKKLENQLNIRVNTSIPLNCLVCKRSKIKRFPFKGKIIKATRPLEIIHSDLSGIIRLTNEHNFRYFLVFMDDYTRYRTIFLLARKYQVYNAFVEYKCYMENQVGNKIRILHTDNGTEYCNQLMDNFLSKNGIQRELTIPGSPEQNGLAEREMGIVVQNAINNLVDSNLSHRFWPEAIAHSTYIKNRTPSSAIGGHIPYTMMFNEAVKFDKLHRFGHVVIVLNLNTEHKFDPPGKAGIFVGYPNDKSGYEVYLLKDKVIKVAREVLFLSKEESDQFIVQYRNQIPMLDKDIELNKLEQIENDTSQDRQLDNHNNLWFTTNDDDGQIESVNCSANHNVATTDLSNQTHENTNQEEENDNQVDSEQDPQNTEDEIESQQLSEQIDDRSVEQEIELENRQEDQINIVDNDSETTRNGGDNSSSAYRYFEHINLYNTESPTGRFVLSSDEIRRLKDRFVGCKFVHIAPYRSKKKEKMSLYEINSLRAPSTYKDAINSTESERWMIAMKDEYLSLVNNNTFDLVPRPINKRILPVMWMYTIKTNKYGEIERYKARCVILGNLQLNVEKQKINSPVINGLSLRIFLTIAVKYKMIIHTMDIKTAYLNADLREEIYIQQPPGFIVKPNHVCRLRKSMYGLRSSAKNWFTTLKNCLDGFGLKQLFSDEFMFSNCESNVQERIMVVVHVDDLAVATQKLELMNKFKNHLKNQFELTDNGPISEFLGMSFDYQDNVLVIDQRKYICELLEKYNMQNCKNVRTPIGSGINLLDDSQPLLNDTLKEEFASIVGGLNYLASTGRLDISYVTNVLCRFISSPNMTHYETAKRVLRYLHNTIDLRIKYQPNDTSVIYADADHANCTSSKSISGVCAVLFGCLISWSSYKQNKVATSTNESEVLATLDGVNEAEFIICLLNELKVPIEKPIVLFNDNTSCNSSIENGGHFRSNKHFRIRINRIRRAVEDGLVKVEHVPGELMVADLLTKQLTADRVNKLLQIVNVQIN